MTFCVSWNINMLMDIQTIESIFELLGTCTLAHSNGKMFSIGRVHSKGRVVSKGKVLKPREQFYIWVNIATAVYRLLVNPIEVVLLF